MRIVLYAGKGGAGKTTTAAATALAAAARGRRTLVLSADPAHSLGDVLGAALGAQPRKVAPGAEALEVDPFEVLERHWGSIRRYLAALFRHQGIEEEVAEELALLPGAEELAVLLALEEQLRAGSWELVVVDCAPTGSTLRLLSFPEVARGTLRFALRMQRLLAAVVAPLARPLAPVPLPRSEVFRDAERLLFARLRSLGRLLDDERASVRLVVTPERMVIEEARRAHTDLGLFGLGCDAVVINRLLPKAAAREPFFRGWSKRQGELCAEVERLFAPLRILRAPLAEDELRGVERLARHGAELFAGCEPDALLSAAPRPRYRRTGEGYRVELALPHARAEELRVAKLDEELVVETAGRRRALLLPRSLAGLALRRARLERGRLVVELARAGTG